jgi:Leucine-rich repeat (LRR) protein
LKYINASYNRLGKFPDGLGSLFKVEEADFSYNNIQTVQYVCVCVCVW